MPPMMLVLPADWFPVTVAVAIAAAPFAGAAPPPAAPAPPSAAPAVDDYAGDAPATVGLLPGAVLSHGWVGSVLVGGEEDGDFDGALPEGHRSSHQGKQGGEAQAIESTSYGGRCRWRCWLC